LSAEGATHLLLKLIAMEPETRNPKDKTFFELADRFRDSTDPKEIEQLGDELGCLVFGE
jgi:hypothetical protein